MKDNWIWINESLPTAGSKVAALTSTGEIVFDMTYKGRYYNEEEDTCEWCSDCTLWRGRVVAWQALPKFPNNFYEKLDELGGE